MKVSEVEKEIASQKKTLTIDLYVCIYMYDHMYI